MNAVLTSWIYGYWMHFECLNLEEHSKMFWLGVKMFGNRAETKIMLAANTAPKPKQPHSWSIFIWNSKMRKFVYSLCKNIAKILHVIFIPLRSLGKRTGCSQFVEKHQKTEWKIIATSHPPSLRSRANISSHRHNIFNDAAIVQTLNICIFEKNAQTEFKHKYYCYPFWSTIIQTKILSVSFHLRRLSKSKYYWYPFV